MEARRRGPSVSQAQAWPSSWLAASAGSTPGSTGRGYSISAQAGRQPSGASTSSAAAQCTELFTCPAVSKSVARTGQGRAAASGGGPGR